VSDKEVVMSDEELASDLLEFGGGGLSVIQNAVARDIRKTVASRLRILSAQRKRLLEWAKDRALPSNSEFVQGVRSAQDRVLRILRDSETQGEP
jgi:arginine repressor